MARDPLAVLVRLGRHAVDAERRALAATAARADALAHEIATLTREIESELRLAPDAREDGRWRAAYVSAARGRARDLGERLDTLERERGELLERLKAHRAELRRLELLAGRRAERARIEADKREQREVDELYLARRAGQRES